MNKLILILALSAFIFTVSCSNCLGAQIYDSAKNTCLSNKSDCSGYISRDQYNCVTECQPNESVYEYEVEGIILFKQCFICEGKQVLTLNQKTQLYYCSDSCLLNYQTAGNDKICRCNKKTIFDYYSYTYQCSDSCQNKEYFMQKDLNGIYSCVYKCDTQNGYVQEGETLACIQKNQCKTYILDGKCISSCKYFIYEKENNQSYQICDQKCDYNPYYPDDDTQLCVRNCPQGYYETDEQCIPKEECKSGKISYDGKSCLDNCAEGTYPLALSKDLYQCQICYQYLLYDEKANLVQCVDSCPLGYIPFQQYYNACIPFNQCDLLNSDRSQCVQNCQYPDFLINGSCVNPCQGKSSDCVPECEQGYFKYTNNESFECLATCNYFISSNGKQCIESCHLVNEIASQNFDQCLACKSQEIIQYNLLNDEYECLSINSLTLDEQLRNFDISVEKGEFDYLDVQNKKERVKNLYQQIIAQKDTGKIIEQLEFLVEMAEKLIIIINQSKSFSIENSDKSFLLKLELPRDGYKLKKTFDLTKFLSDSSYSQFEPSPSAVQYDQDLQNVYSLLSLKNPFCKSETCKFSKLFFTKVHSPKIRFLSQISSSLPYQVTIPVDKSITELDKLICVSYNNFGEMIANIEWTSLSQDKTSVTCSYASNTALYIDSTCQFINQSLCTKTEQQKPQEEEQINQDEDDISLSGGAIAGIVLGCIFGTLLISFVVYKLVFNRKRQYQSKEQKDQRNFETIVELNKQV